MWCALRSKGEGVEVTTRKIVCDECHSDEGVTRWRVVNPSNRAVSLDLCMDHAEMLERLFAKFPQGKRGQHSRSRMVYTEEQIRRQVSPRKKTPPKKK